YIVVSRQSTPDLAIPALVMDGGNFHLLLILIVDDTEEAEIADARRREELRDKALVTIVGPDVAKRAVCIAIAGDIRHPFAVLVRWLDAHALDVAHHRKAERIGIDAREAAVVEIRLHHNARVRVQELEKCAVRNLPLLVQAVHDAMV